MPRCPTPFVGGREKAWIKALWGLVLTPSCSTGCTFHSESSRGRGLGEVRPRGGEQSGRLWGGSPRELQAGQGSDLNHQGGREPQDSGPVCGPFRFSSPQAKTLKPYLRHVPRRYGGQCGVTLNLSPLPTWPQSPGMLMGLHSGQGHLNAKVLQGGAKVLQGGESEHVCRGN